MKHFLVLAAFLVLSNLAQGAVDFKGPVKMQFVHKIYTAPYVEAQVENYEQGPVTVTPNNRYTDDYGPYFEDALLTKLRDTDVFYCYAEGWVAVNEALTRYGITKIPVCIDMNGKILATPEVVSLEDLQKYVKILQAHIKK